MAFSSKSEHWWLEAGKPDLGELVEQLLHFYRCPQISVLQKALISAALLYCLAPLDLVPDCIPILGWLDDITVVKLVRAWVKYQLQRSRLTCPRYRQTCYACD